MPSGVYVRTKAIIAALKLAAPHSAESRQRQAEKMRGKKLPPRSESYREKQRAVVRKPHTPEAKAKIGAFFRGRPLTDEHRAKLRAAASKREGGTTPELLKAAEFMRRCLHRLGRQERGVRTALVLGYTREQLRAHLEAQFSEGMTWFNYGNGGWHVDHIYPVARFVKAGITDPRIVNALANLRPIWAKENHRKSSRVAS
jgi:hypothetical protein